VKQLLLIRHAKSSWSNPDLEDMDRPLNKRGLRDAPFMAAYCRSQELIVDAIFSSPANRAYTTASFFEKEFQNEIKCFDKETELYFGSETDWMHLINELDESYDLPAFFSHNPTITYFSNMFAKEPQANVVTCGVVHLVSSVDSWKDLDYSNTYVRNFYFPKLVRES